MLLKNFKLLFLLTLPLSTYTNSSYAECAREDIDHYLNKGFTPEQITAICTKALVRPADKKSTDNSKLITETNIGQNTLLKKNEQLLIEAIKGRNILLTNDALQYTLKICVEYGEEDLYGFAPNACPVIKFIIARKNLEVIKSQKKYIFFGDNEIKIKATIEREVISGLEKNKPYEKKLIQQQIETGDYTFIPIRDDISLTDVEQVLRQLSH